MTVTDTCGEMRDLLFYLDDQEIEVMQEYLTPLSLKKDEVLFEVKSVGDAQYIICQGRLAVRKFTGFDEKMLVIALLGRGASVGECGILEDHHRSATVFAIEDCDLLRLEAADYQILKKNHPHIAIKLLERMLMTNNVRLDQCTGRLAHIL